MVRWLLPLCGLLIALTPLGAAGSSRGEEYRRTRIVRPTERAAFYRSGGRGLIGRKIHLHVEPRVMRKQPKVFGSPSGGDWLVFENRTVPIAVKSRNPSWRECRTKLHQTDELCIRGVLRVPKTDPRKRVHLYVKTIKRAPGSWR